MFFLGSYFSKSNIDNNAVAVICKGVQIQLEIHVWNSLMAHHKGEPGHLKSRMSS